MLAVEGARAAARAGSRTSTSARDGHIVLVRPEIVVEIAFNDVQRSSLYPGGLALRHARVVRYREDRTVAESDSIEAVRAIAIADGVIS